MTVFWSPTPGRFDEVDAAFEAAAVVQPLGSLQEARELLAAGNSAIERFAPSFLCLVTSMAMYSRMVAAIAPRRRFRGGALDESLRSLAGIGSLVPRLGRALQDRCDLRLHILAEGFETAGRYLFRAATGWFKGDEFAGLGEDAQIAALRADFGALAESTVADFESLLASLPHAARARHVDSRRVLTLVPKVPRLPEQN